MKKLFLLMPLAFLALTGCTNGETSNNGSNSESKTEDAGQTQTQTDTKTESSETEEAAALQLTNPVDNKTFYLGMNHPGSTGSKNNIESGLYCLTGSMAAKPAQFFMETVLATDNIAPSGAAKIKTIKDGDGWNLQVESTGKYIAAVMSDTHRNAVFQDTKHTWTYNEAQHTFVTQLSGKDVILGTQKKEYTYNTVGIVDAKFDTNIYLQLYK